ncbi:MAG TPA: 2-amino-4-hydroxy-6-hydroxymethyldihydropteridine diphosphokinase [Bacteroidia bacterium]|nr:2-amino-4-hydroxy-6-hydroxymethyldihydropteridine diphosphokinase [Bacteroidia bacterium]HOZ91171.1 2-amino-4-hydroxy-6-hydroxymethyldihydropteridine diphosphokinase [Bacteroidia bacterium]HRC36327.1 2-amino-4-hydroxy-6-hydroxymethyldihydropteridine diphosphokinase [Bacteroidia bacterium]
MAVAYLLLGGNQGETQNTFIRTIELIKLRIGAIKTQSSIYKTAAWGNTNQPDFLNQVIEVNTLLHPNHLLNQILSIELELGRKRDILWGQRIIDIDILFYDALIYDSIELTIPHKYLHTRMFALIPLHEIAPQLVHPILQKNIKALIEACDDKLAVTKISKTD